MAELLEQIKQLSREEQLALVQQIWDLDAEPISEEERQMLIGRAQEAAKDPRGGTPWAEVKARMMAKMQVAAS